jgi:predicted HAD superfamily phosphohydrolase YqeG
MVILSNCSPSQTLQIPLFVVSYFSMTGRISPWETFRAPLTSEDPHFVECKPDLHVPDLLDLSADVITDLTVEHVFVDFDGTMAANGNRPPVAEPMLDHVRSLATDARFKTFGIATDNRAPYMESIAASLGEHVKLFQPNETPSGPIMKFHPGFYRRILFETDTWDNPELVVMIGDSLRYDILPAQQLGMKTILIDRMEKRMASHLRQRVAEIRTQQADEN